MPVLLEIPHLSAEIRVKIFQSRRKKMWKNILRPTLGFEHVPLSLPSLPLRLQRINLHPVEEKILIICRKKMPSESDMTRKKKDQGPRTWSTTPVGSFHTPEPRNFPVFSWTTRIYWTLDFEDPILQSWQGIRYKIVPMLVITHKSMAIVEFIIIDLFLK